MHETIKKTKMISSDGDWKCMVCDSSFFQQEHDGIECKWVQCQKCNETSCTCHLNASQKFTEYISLMKVKTHEEENRAEDSDNYNL